MAKKGSAKPRARTKKKKAGFSPKLQFMKIMAGLVLLVCLVVTAGLLANRFLMRPSPPVVSKPKPIPITRPETGPVHHSVPDYEAFHREVVPPPPPITRIKPVINGIPVAIIIDDIGYDRKMADGFLALDIPLTFSVLPQGTFNHSIIDKALKKGDVEIMLHLPMEPGNYPSVNPGPGALLSSMNPDELIDQLNANLDRVPNAKGVNNHMGSKLTASSEQMRQIFTILPFGERDVFIDHIQTPEFVRKQLKLLIKRARRQGYAIGIAHPHPVTLEVLKEMLPELKDAVLFTHASQVVAFQQG
ncbi:MAG: divergent polysaccharide deacetylase family protein [Desulfosarcina sp.]|nr:divergent polysaccharide deacetylase family protein [Desulfosarcina sp.]